MLRMGLLVVVVATLGGVLGWFLNRPPSAARSPEANLATQPHAPSHAPRPEEVTAVEEEEPVAREELPMLEHGVSPSLKHLLLFTASACAQRVLFWTSKEELFSADLRLTGGKDGVTASVLRDVTKRPPFERCLDRELRTQPVTDIELTAPEMRTYFSLAETTDLEKRPGELPESAEVLALVKRCAAGTPLLVRYEAVVGEAAVVIEKPELQAELDPTARQCLRAGLERRIAFTEESRPGWKGLHAELKVDATGTATKSTMKFTR